MDFDLTRRDTLRIALAAGALAVLGSCRLSNPQRDFKIASKDLKKALDRIAENDAERAELASLARRIEVGARELIDDQLGFLRSFDRLTANPEVPAADIRRLNGQFTSRRTEQRNAILRMQGEIRAKLSDAEWDEVVEILNRKGEAVDRARMS